jgi:hypothetical protein
MRSRGARRRGWLLDLRRASSPAADATRALMASQVLAELRRTHMVASRLETWSPAWFVR